MLRRHLLPPLVVVLGALALPCAAGAAIRGGVAEDPREAGPVRADAAAAAARHDDRTGELTLVVRLHDPAPEEAPLASWALGGARGGPGCDVTTLVAGVEHALDSGEAVVELRADDETEPVAVRAQVTRSADGREVRVDARDARLAGKAITCAQVQLGSGDEVAPIDLTGAGAAAVAGPADAPGGAGGGPAPGVPGAPPPTGSSSTGAGDGSTGAGGPSGTPGRVRIGRTRIATRRSGRTTTVTVRARVCAPRGRLDLVATERRTARGARRARTIRHRFARTQRARCQEHRVTWRFRSGAPARVSVRVALAAARP